MSDYILLQVMDKNREEYYYEVSNTLELLDIKIVKAYSKLPQFYRYSLDNNMLIAECYMGAWSYLIGYLSSGHIELPDYIPLKIIYSS